MSKIALVSALLLIPLVTLQMQVYGITNFYFELCGSIDEYDLDNDSVFTVEHDDESGARTVSWVYNDSGIFPGATTFDVPANFSAIDLHARNEFLLAIADDLDIGTRVYMCVDLNLYLMPDEERCQTDAVDKDRVAHARFHLFIS